MNIDAAMIKTMARLGQNRSFFGLGMPEVAKNVPGLYVITADLGGYSGMNRFTKKYPEKVINVGIAEQQMINVAAGLAMEDNLVYAGSYAAFATARAMEQVKHNMSALNLNIKLVGYSSGYSKESLGVSHWATEDIAMTRCLPHMTVISPADSLEAVKACIETSKMKGPVYIRLCGAENCPIVYHRDYEFRIGKGIILRKGNDVVLFCHGRMAAESLKAAEILKTRGIDAEVVNIHTIKPIDVALVKQEISTHIICFSVEEHNVVGGLGSALAEVIAELGKPVRFRRIGMQDRLYRLGTEKYIWEQAGLTGEQIADTVENESDKGAQNDK